MTTPIDRDARIVEERLRPLPPSARLIHLAELPDRQAVEADERVCHVCDEPDKNTEEHVPPKAAFNSCTRLWNRLHGGKARESAGRVRLRGGFRVRTLCEPCNTQRCSQYARAYVSFVKNLVEGPRIVEDSAWERRLTTVENPLFIAKEIATMILALHSHAFCKANEGLQSFVRDPRLRFDPGFRVYGFLVPDHPHAGTIQRYHGRVDTFAPGFAFHGGEVSLYPFGFVFCHRIGSAYSPNQLADITHWFWRKDRRDVVAFPSMLTATKSPNELASGLPRTAPQIDRVGPLVG